MRAILGLPIPLIRERGPAASVAILAEGHGRYPVYDGVPEALAAPDTALRLFGKPEVRGKRRVGVALALGSDIEDARARARRVAAAVRISLS